MSKKKRRGKSDYEKWFMRFRFYRPTVVDVAGLCGESEDVMDYFVMPFKRTRDSNEDEELTFALALAKLGGESSWVRVCRYAHWGYGWIELILVSPSAHKTLNKAMKLAITWGHRACPLFDYDHPSAIEEYAMYLLTKEEHATHRRKEKESNHDKEETCTW